MGALTEAEIFDCLATNFKLAAELSETMAKIPLKGECYDRLRKTLRLIEGACKQAAVWREDTRWLPIGRMMAECHAKAGGWLRGYKVMGVRVAWETGAKNEAFAKLAENLQALHKVAEDMRTKATGRVGMILPDVLPARHRDTRPVGYRAPNVSPGGIILPSPAMVQ